MARRDDDDESEDIQEKPRPKRPRPESVQPDKARRPAPREEDDAEPDDRQRRRRPSREDEDDDDDRPRKRRSGGAIIPYRNAMALAAYYCSFGGLIFILGSLALAAALAPDMSPKLFFALAYGGGGLCAVLAIIFGVIGLVKANRNPEARGTAHAIIAMILGGLEVAGLIVLMFLALRLVQV